MANNLKSKSNKRRPVRKRSPLSRSIKSTSSVPKPAGAKKPVNKTSKRVSAKTAPRKPKINQKQLISLPLGRGVRLALTLNIVSQSGKTTAKKTIGKPKKTPIKKSKKQEIMLSAGLILIGIIGSVFFGLRAAIYSPPPLAANPPIQKVAALPPAAKRFLSYSPPTRLNIPSIQLDTELTTTDLRPDGTIEVPEQYNIAGWYKKSPTPGQIGPSIIVGHLDNVKGIAVFWRLHELSPGQQITVNRKDGSAAQFVITKIQQYPQGNFPTSEVYGNLDYAGLRLITCGGSFNRLTGHYSDNTVIFASLV